MVSVTQQSLSLSVGVHVATAAAMSRLPYEYRGLIVPVFTPFNKSGSLNLDAIPQYAYYLMAREINGILVCGTSGEGMLMSVNERKLVAEAWVKATKNKNIHLMIQVGGAPLPDVIELAKHAESLRVDSILCLPELYFKPTTSPQLIEYLEIVGKAAPNTPLLYYHIPVFTNVNIHMGEFLNSIGDRIPTFVGIKFTSANLEEAADAMRADNKNFVVFLGNDHLISAACMLGMDSFIVTSANICPQRITNLILASRDGEISTAKDLQEFVSQRIHALGPGNWVKIMKQEMNNIAWINGMLGPPRAPL